MSNSAQGPRKRRPAGRETRVSLRWLVAALVLAAAASLVPFWAPLLLAAWLTLIAWPLQRRLAKGLRHRSIAAACIAVSVTLAFLVPLSLAVTALYAPALALAQRLAGSQSGVEALKALSQGTDREGFDLRHLNAKQLLDFARQHGANAFGAARTLLSAASFTVVSLVVFAGALFVFLVDGAKLRGWLLEHSPLARPHHHRFENAFAEVGRGLIVGIGLTAFAQGAVATVGYVVTGVPRALVLGVITMFASLVPSVGSGLVWVPVAAGLWLSGQGGAAVTLLVFGLVVSVTDNALRPLLSRYAALRMHGLLLFIAMLGGLVLFGGWGLLLGPLFVRCAVEGLEMLREQDDTELAGRESELPLPAVHAARRVGSAAQSDSKKS